MSGQIFKTYITFKYVYKDMYSISKVQIHERTLTDLKKLIFGTLFQIHYFMGGTRSTNALHIFFILISSLEINLLLCRQNQPGTASNLPQDQAFAIVFVTIKVSIFSY